MKSTHGRGSNPKTYTSRPALGVMALVLAIIAAVVIISQTEMFQLRPASGTARAIAEAAAPPAAESAKP
ncbi:hypothetical protein [Sphingomonas sp. Leaf357]|uniref:hypothetical protein n=1 Tax=Sphingomonas sp. Leaf357 TaxID=1736350 RepID=UPI000AF1EDA1|nr:hypothetical protein [Sphingomonas sp. Leaf357]